MKRKALRAAFPYTLSIWVEFLFLGLSYGLLMKSMGLPIFYILAMSIFIFAGSMEFVTVNLLVGAFQPLNAFIMTLMVNARHLFYGLAMLGKYRDTGWKKGYLIFGGPGLVLLLHHPARSNLLGVQRRPGLSGGLRPAH